MKLFLNGFPTVLQHGDRGVVTKMPQDHLFCITFYRVNNPLLSDGPNDRSHFLLGESESGILNAISLIAWAASLKEREIERTKTNWTFVFEQQR